MNDSLVSLGLATHTRAHAGQRLASAVGNAITAIFTSIAAFTNRHASSRGADGILDRIFDLILNCPIA